MLSGLSHYEQDIYKYFDSQLEKVTGMIATYFLLISQKKKKKLYIYLIFFFGGYAVSLVAASRVYSLLRFSSFSLQWLFLLWSSGSRRSAFSSCSSWAQAQSQ